MSRISAGVQLAQSRADEAYRRLMDHCLGCAPCRAKEECPDSLLLLRAWSQAHRAVRG
ncbi:hypothetical protein [Streptomyces sp. NEAU-NA10]|uniref:hypothetical protein n=1 Tax=Streptomyces sp. NEAU-NA10 TaxID=3416050 RepID=UPI003CC58558